MTQEHDIRYSILSDYSFLFECLSDPEDLKYYPMSEGKELEDGAKNWIGFSRYKCSLTAVIGDKPVGIATLFLMPYRKVAHLCLFYMIVDKKHRRKGIGTSLLNNLGNLAHKYFSLESFHAEIYEGSPIIPLLEKLKFQKVVEQENFMKLNNKYYSRVVYEQLF